MKATFLSRFTPSMMTPEALEALFVQREKLAQRLVELIRESVLTPSKHHSLLIGPRGIGKTHLISLIYHRIRAMGGLSDHLLIAWLREEEWGVTSFQDLLMRLFRALLAEHADAAFAERVEALYKLPPSTVERAAGALLKEFVGNRTLLILVENLDDLFRGLGDRGQKRLRAYLQENPFCTILATAQSLFNGVSLRTSPFFGFFHTHHLEDLTLDEATRLLTNIADLEGDRELASFIQTPTGRARIRAVHHLAGGNHRVYVIFSQFLTRESLDEFVEPFMRTLDDLTPYYQGRMAWLSSQQRKIVEFLCDRRRAVVVKEIAQRCFLTHQTASSQLKTLREMEYVHSVSAGRESYYELREPLMRLCVEVKKHRGEPIRLLVDFLRLWYSQTELYQRLELLHPDATIEREYVLHALQVCEQEKEDPRVAACLKDCDIYHSGGDFARGLQTAEELVAIRGQALDWVEQGHYLIHLERWDEALASFDKAIELGPNNAPAWRYKGVALDELGRHEEALISFDKALELDPNYVLAWGSRGIVLGKLDRLDEALLSFGKVVELAPSYVRGWRNRGFALDRLGRFDEASMSFAKAIELDPNDAQALVRQGIRLSERGHHEEALASLQKAIKLNPNDGHVWFHLGFELHELERRDEALVSYNKAIELDPNNIPAWGNKGVVLGEFGRHEEALASFDKVAQLDTNDARTWYHQGVTLHELGRLDEALTSYSKAIELEPNFALAWSNRGATLNNLGRQDEALASFDKAIQLDTNNPMTWRQRSIVLSSLGRYDEALASCNKAIELGHQSSSVFFDRAECFLALGRWEEGYAALDDALRQFAHADKPETGDTAAIARNLLTSTPDVTTWRMLITVLIELYDKNQVVSALGQGLVRSIPTLTSPIVSDATAQMWLDAWRELAGDRAEFQLPFRLLDTAIRHRETHDSHILLELPAEERTLLEPLLAIPDRTKPTPTTQQR